MKSISGLQADKANTNPTANPIVKIALRMSNPPVIVRSLKRTIEALTTQGAIP